MGGGTKHGLRIHLYFQLSRVFLLALETTAPKSRCSRRLGRGVGELLFGALLPNILQP